MASTADWALKTEDLSLYYSQTQALNKVSIQIPLRQVTSFIGPSGCGKSTLLRCFNRLNELTPGVSISGKIYLGTTDIYADEVDVTSLRQRIGMVFQKPNPFPKSIFENIAFGLRLKGIRARSELGDRVEAALRGAALWDEVKHRLQQSALGLSGGQQQRLVIARAIAVEPEILLLDEPASALDPISTLKLEELIVQLKEQYTIAIVTHNMQQAARISDITAFLYLGEVVEMGPTDVIFTSPTVKQTEDYITGRYG